MNNVTRLPYLKPKEMNSELRAFYDDVIDGLDRPGLPHITKLAGGQMIGPFTAMFNFPEFGEPLYRLQLKVIKQSEIPKDINELFILVIVCDAGAAYAIYAHEALSLDAGVDAETVRAVKAGETPKLKSADAKAAYALAKALTKSGVVPKDVYCEALARFGAKGLNALIHTAALFKYLSVLMNAYDEPVPEAEG